MYKRLAQYLDKTRTPLWRACLDLDIDYDNLDFDKLDGLVTQCTHCDIWTSTPTKDLDYNPICKVCVRIAGL